MRDPEDFTVDNMTSASADGEILAEFTGRELLMASIEEKCFHQVLTKIIEEDENDDSDLEARFVEMLVNRLNECEEAFAQRGMFVADKCLFDKQKNVDKAYLPTVEKCV